MSRPTDSLIHPPEPTTMPAPLPTLLPRVPASLQPPHAPPAPIAFPDRPAGSRAEQPSDSTRRRWERMGKAIDAARTEGHADGVRQGYTQGWRWGLWCGVVLGAVVASIAWALWLTATAPAAAPPSARPAVAMQGRP